MAINVVDVKKLGLVDPIGEALTPDYAPSNNTSKPRYRVHKDKLILYISNTLINQFFERGNEKEYCPKAVWEQYMVSNYRKSPTDSMIKGSYFETKAIGGGAGGSRVDSLPLKRGGKLTKDNERIDEQVAKFKMLCDEYGIIISDDSSNVQVKGMKHYPQDQWLDVEVFITAEADIISPIENYRGHSFDMAIIDLKLTKDLHSTFGPYAWGNKEFINTQQGTIYHLVFDNLPFFFWVFDYSPKGLSNEIIPVNHDTKHPNEKLAQKAKWRISSTHEVIRKTITEISHNFIEGWLAKPSPQLCKGCPVADCKERNTLEEI